jgi:uncharacterized YigZ family protein
MLFSHSYQTVNGNGEALYKEKGSKFFAFAFPVLSDEEFRKHLQELKQQYPDATHHCYALVLNPDQGFQKCSDDGEPFGTAGKPILRAILSAGVTNTGIVVVRYFGGTQLGVPGLIRAYKTAASDALKQCRIIEKAVEDLYELKTGFVYEADARKFIKLLNARIIASDFAEGICFRLAIPRSESQSVSVLLQEYYYLEIRELAWN